MPEPARHDNPAAQETSPLSVWLPRSVETTARERLDEPRRHEAQPVTSEVPRSLAVSEAAEAKEPEDSAGSGKRTRGGEPGRPGQWLPPELKPEANPLATGAWLVPDQPVATDRDKPAASGPATDKRAATPATDEPAVEPVDVSPTATDEPAGAAVTKQRVHEPESPGGTGSAAYGQRTRAAVAYCRELFPTDTATERASQILGSLSGGIRDERVLLELTRTAAGDLLDASGAEAHRAPQGCRAISSRLAARANGTLDAEERSRLEHHLASCPVCKAVELRAARADRTFSAVLALALHDRVPA